ncbi:MAG TPA: molybdenum cofactor guanylyltransferase [Flavobacteriaceae bacterium]|nr:molybdenum cofactor guanylyltransferase [Flavobacteriaceae bacterium]
MTSRKKISAYILCGGKSSRMKMDKGLLLYQNKTFVENIINAIEPITNSIFLVTNNDAYNIFGLPIISDIYKNKGPIGGIYTALKYTKTDKNLIISCDVPKITTSILKKYLIENCENSDLTFVSDGENDFPLIGIYSKSIVQEFETAIKNNHLKLLRLIETLCINKILVENKDASELMNVNTKDDLERLNIIQQ